MRPVHVAQLDQMRPVLILTRDLVRPYLSRVTVAPITSTIRGLSTEVPVAAHSDPDHSSVVRCDDIVTVPTSTLGRRLGSFHTQEPAGRRDRDRVRLGLTATYGSGERLPGDSR